MNPDEKNIKEDIIKISPPSHRFRFTLANLRKCVFALKHDSRVNLMGEEERIAKSQLILLCQDIGELFKSEVHYDD